MSAILFLFAADAWHTYASLRAVLPGDSKPVAYWRAGNAAFLAASVPGKGIWSVVRADGGRIEVLWDGERVRGPGKRVESLDWSGVQTPAHVILFHTEPALARSVFSFDTGDGEGTLSFVLTGVAPGVWEIWRNGWVTDPGVTVRAGEAVLHFDGRSGSYFIRRLG